MFLSQAALTDAKDLALAGNALEKISAEVTDPGHEVLGRDGDYEVVPVKAALDRPVLAVTRDEKTAHDAMDVPSKVILRLLPCPGLPGRH